MVAFPDALRMARERGLDLVLISPNAIPVVCRIADLGKLKYEEAKKEKEARKSQKGGLLKEVKISPTIAIHDLNVRIAKAKELLEKKCKVKVSMYFRGRENMHVDIGQKVMNGFIESVSEAGKVDSPPKKIGKILIAILAPK